LHHAFHRLKPHELTAAEARPHVATAFHLNLGDLIATLLVYFWREK
jgi:hypothetical protein